MFFMVYAFDFAPVKKFVEKKSHRLLLRPGRSAPVPGRSNVAERDGLRVGERAWHFGRCCGRGRPNSASQPAPSGAKSL
jgi:hypothetical protein